MRYKLQAGSVAWAVHRGTGILLTLYIFFHLFILSSLKDPIQYRSLINIMQDPFVKAGEFVLLAIVVAHALNGTRVVLIDIGLPTRFQKLLFLLTLMIMALVLAFSVLYFAWGSIH